jgi:hypothetical protein
MRTKTSYVFPKKCSVCLSDCSSTRELFGSTSSKVGFVTEVTNYKCSVPVCEQCQGKFGRISYGWLTWFAVALIGAVVGGTLGSSSPRGSVGGGAALGAAIFGILGLFPSLFVSAHYAHKTEDPVYLSKLDGRPCFRNKEYQRIFDELNRRED